MTEKYIRFSKRIYERSGVRVVDGGKLSQEFDVDLGEWNMKHIASSIVCNFL